MITLFTQSHTRLFLVSLCWFLTGLVLVALPKDVSASADYIEKQTNKIASVNYRAHRVTSISERLLADRIEGTWGEFKLSLLLSHVFHLENGLAPKVYVYDVSNHKALPFEMTLKENPMEIKGNNGDTVDRYNQYYAQLTLTTGHIYRAFIVYPDKRLKLSASTIAGVSTDVQYFICDSILKDDINDFRKTLSQFAVRLPDVFKNIYCDPDVYTKFNGGGLFETAAYYYSTDIIESLINDYGVNLNQLDRLNTTFVDWLDKAIVSKKIDSDRQTNLVRVRELVTKGYGAKTARDLLPMPAAAEKLCVPLNNYMDIRRLCIEQDGKGLIRWHAVNVNNKRLNVTAPEVNGTRINAIYPSPSGQYFVVRSKKMNNVSLSVFDTLSLFHSAKFDAIVSFEKHFGFLFFKGWADDLNFEIASPYDLTEKTENKNKDLFTRPKPYIYNLDSHTLKASK